MKHGIELSDKIINNLLLNPICLQNLSMKIINITEADIRMMYDVSIYLCVAK